MLHNGLRYEQKSEKYIHKNKIKNFQKRIYFSYFELIMRVNLIIFGALCLCCYGNKDSTDYYFWAMAASTVSMQFSKGYTASNFRASF